MPWEGMPKHLGKGITFATLDERYRDPVLAASTLVKLRQKGATGNFAFELAEVGSIDAVIGKPASALFTPPPTKNHLNEHWFGRPQNPDRESTGWWHGWKGQPEAVMRETLIRSLEVALGLNHDAAPTTANITRTLPVDFYWICGLPRFESYVSWNESQVTAIILTPGFGEGDLILEVMDEPADPQAMLDTFITGQDSGIIFVGQNIKSATVKLVEMDDPVIVHRLDWDRGGAGTWQE